MERDNVHRRLMATVRSLKKQKQRLKAAQETLNRRWNKVLDTEEKYGDDRHTKSYPKRKLLQNSTMRPFHRRTIRPGGRTNHFVTAIEQLLTAHTIYMSSWIKRPARPGPSMDLEDTPRRRTMVTKTIRLIEYQFGISTGHNNSQRHATTHPNTEEPLTLCASSKRYWTTNFHRVLNL